MAAKTTIQWRRDTAANWTSVNPVLAAGEAGFETDTNKFKLGDGTTAWSSLTYKSEPGAAGTDGTDGTNGVGVPVGGTTGQILSKIDGTDYNTQWTTASGGTSDPRLNTRTGYYYGPATQGSTTAGASLVMVANRMFAVPYLVGAAFTADRIAIAVTGSISGTSIRLLIYTSTTDGTAPDTVLLNAGTVNSGAGAADREITISQALSANTLYWLVAVSDGAPTVRARNASTFGVPFPAISSLGSTTGTWYKDSAGSYATPPAYGTPTAIAAAQLGILLRAE